jgi:hypothetical protein
MSTQKISPLRLHLRRKPTVLEEVAETLGYCCLYQCIVQTTGTSSAKLAEVWGVSAERISQLRRHRKAHLLKCTNRPTRCIAP